MLTLSDIRKHFGATRALDGVTLDIRPGRVHALVGENGAGKSTLMHVIAGGLSPDGGTMTMAGAAYRPSGPLAARQAGVALIHQELSLCDHLTVAENILLGREPRRGGRYDRAAARAEAGRVLAPFHHPELHPDRLTRDLPIAARQVVEICRAVSADARVVLMDEPTSSLPREDVARLFDQVRRLRDDGVAVVYISHFLEEVRELADDLSVLRDGRTVWTGTVDALDDGQIIGHMVGRDVADLFPARRRPSTQSVRLAVNDVSVGGRVHGATLQVRAGEVLGIAGLVGAGRTELLRGLMGLETRPVSGRLSVDGRDVPLATRAPWLRLSAGLGYLSEDRKGEGLTLPMSLADNMTCTHYGAVSRRGVIDGPTQRRAGQKWLERLRVKARTPMQPVRTLSGGNQQKIALARLLHQEATTWLLDEPTRGVDVGSKVQLYEAIADAADQGCAILLVSSYLPELFGLCDSLAVMCRGCLTAARPLAEWTPERVMAAAIGTQAASAGGALLMDARLKTRLSALAPVLGLLLVIAAFAVMSDDPAQYLSSRNLRIVFAQTVIVALGAIGMTFIIIGGGIDLAVGSTIALAGVVTALALRAGYPPPAAMAAGVATGGVVGLVNGLAITRLKVLPFIATLGMLGIARGVAKWLADQQTVNAPTTWVNELAVTFPTPSWLLVAPGVWISLVLAIIATFVLQRTVFGRRVFAIGSNEDAARACGVRTDRLKVWIYGLAGLLFGLAGVMQMSRLRQGDPTVAIGTELDVIAAVVIGGGSLAGGEGTIAGSLVGALVMAFLRNGSQQMGWPNYVQEIIIGIIIVLAVAADRARRAKSA